MFCRRMQSEKEEVSSFRTISPFCLFWEDGILGGGGLFAVDYEEFFEEHECQIQQAAQRAKENVKGLDSSTSTHGNTKGILSMSEICATECNRNSSNGLCYRNI
jgi:hypothetical protein